MKNWNSVFFFQGKELVYTNFDFNISIKMNLRIITKKKAIDSAINFAKKSILGPLVFTETTRKRLS